VVQRDSLDYVVGQDFLYGPDDTPNCFSLVWALVRKCFGGEVQTLSDIFDPSVYTQRTGVSTKSVLRAIKSERSDWADLLIRAHTSYHNGTETGASLLQVSDVVNIDGNTRFQKAAREYKIPEEQTILSKMPAPDKTVSTHPYLAAARYLTVTSLRALATSVGAVQEDPCISSNRRDSGAYGERPIHQLKDLGHAPVPSKGVNDNVKTVRTLIDCLSYEVTLRKHSGHDMIIWASYYPELAGETCESVYYADSDSTFVEVVGKDKATSVHRNQIAWDFTPSDIVYIENEDQSAFTVYNVVKYPQPSLLKQVVFLCALQTVNLPYAIVNRLVQWTKGHDLSTVGISTPRPCNNVVLIPKDPERPYTQDILVMSNGTPGCPTASIKYRGATSPRSCATISTELYDFLKSVNTQAGRHLTVHEVIKRLELYSVRDGDICEPGSAAYCELLRTVAWWGELPNVVYYDATKPRTTLAPIEVETARAVLAGPQITNNGPSALAKTDEAMDAYVTHKMEGCRNDTVPSKEWVKISDLILNAWVDCIATETGIEPKSVQLVDREQILNARSKRMQRAREITDGLGPNGGEIGRAELKSEVVHKTKESPRVITNPNYDVSVASGRLGKTLELILKKTQWYNPGLTPQELAEQVASCYEMSRIHESNYEGGGVRAVDYTAADDSHSSHSNRILRKLIEHFVWEGDLEEALFIYDSCFNMPTQVGPKVKSTRMKNASGTGITTVLNTGVFSERELETTVVAMVFRSMLDCGEVLGQGDIPKELTHKLFLRHLRIIQNTWDLNKIWPQPFDKSKMAVKQAYGWIGPKFGDDGLDSATPFVSNEIWECAMLYVDRMDGFKRTFEFSSAVKEEPVEYLSRIYACPSRSFSSFCKVEKAIDKISIALNRDRERYVLKLRGYWTTDRNTPIVGAYIEALANLYCVNLCQIGDGTPVTSEDNIHLLDHNDERRKIYEMDRELYYKIAGGPYPWDEGASELQYECVAKDYNMTSNELYAFDERLRLQSTWKGIQGMMVPAQVAKETPDDPLGLQRKPDPPGVLRVPAFKGDEPRMCTFESIDGGPSRQNDVRLPVPSSGSERTQAAFKAFGRDSDSSDSP